MSDGDGYVVTVRDAFGFGVRDAKLEGRYRDAANQLQHALCGQMD